MNLLFADYNGPTGLYVATGNDLLPLSEPAGATAFVGAGMQAGTIDPEHSAEIQSAVDSAIDSASASPPSAGQFS